MKSSKLSVVPSFALLAALAAACGGTTPQSEPNAERVGTTSEGLDAVPSFGSNPGNLLMYRYAPASMPANAPVVVVLHGCTQTAAQFAGAGWNALADTYKFYVVYVQQQSANNPVSCFDWFGKYNTPSDKTNITRDGGEVLSVKQMVDKTKADFSVDPARVFVAGFSAGGAMAAALLATYPDVFAAGGIDAGIPYNCPSTVNSDVWSCQSPGKSLQPSDWGDRVRQAYPGYSGPYPRVSIWQGSSDTTVATANETELVKQWTNVHGLTQTATVTDTVDGQAHSAFANAGGTVLVESYVVSGMAHGMAVDPSHGCGTAGQYLYDKGICTASHLIRFFHISDPLSDGGTESGTAADAGDAGDSGGSVSDAGDSGTMGHDAGGTHDSGTPVHDSGTSGPDAGRSGPLADGGANGATSGADGGVADNGGWGLAGCHVGPGGARPTGGLIALFGIAVAAVRRRRRANGIQ